MSDVVIKNYKLTDKCQDPDEVGRLLSRDFRPHGATVYTASKPHHAPMWRAIRAAGLDIVATWIDFGDKSEVTDWTKLWVDCAAESALADVTLVYIEPGDELRGAYVEMGCALAAGKRVFFVNPNDVHVTDAVHHPMVSIFGSLHEAIAMIRAS